MNPPEPSLEESIASVLSQVPAPIRDFLTGPERDKILSDLTTKYTLHLDQADVFERQFISMLLGLVQPDEFTGALQTAGIPSETVANITQDLNTLVFLPLQEKMRKAGEGSGAASATAPEIEAVTAPKPNVQSAVGSIVHPPLPTMSTPLAGKVLNRLAPSAPTAPAPMPARMPLQPAAVPIKTPVQTPMQPMVPRPIAPTQSAPAKPLTPPQASQGTALGAALAKAGIPLLSDHEAAHIDFKKPLAPATPPVAPAPVTPPPRAPMPMMPTASAPIKPLAPSTTPAKSYAVDPYREQPEAHEL